MLRVVVIQTALVSTAVGLVVGSLMLMSGFSREAWGLLFGTAVGVMNQLMLANRVARIGEFGSATATQRMLRAGTAMRFLMIGLATIVVVQLHTTVSVATMLVGVIFPTIVANILGARYLLRPDV